MIIPPILHIYAQPNQHDEAYIIGNKDGLIKLREAIDEVLKSGTSSLEAFTNDGEGFFLAITKIDGEEKIKEIALPYSSPDYKLDGIYPWQIKNIAEAIGNEYRKLIK